MWFSNLHIYRLTRPFELDATQLAEKLAEKPFTPCHSQQQESYGWVAPLGNAGNDWVHAANGYIMIAARQQERILPAAVIKEKLEDSIRSIEAGENRKISRKERQSMKDELVFELLPKAFTRSRRQYAYIAPQHQLIVIDSASASRAEALLNALRETIGSLAVVPLTTRSVTGHCMTNWLKSGQLPAPFSAGSECELKDMQQQGGVIRCRHQDLLADEMTAHINTGMMVTRLHLNWKDRIECIVDEKMVVRRLRFMELVQEQASASQADDAASQFDVDFTIMTAELADFIHDLVEAFGGVNHDAQQPAAVPDTLSEARA